MHASDSALLPLVLIGPMGAGKSKIGRRVARTLKVPYIDTDKRIVAAYGPIAEIFAREGEDYFRIVEREVVAAALGEEAVVSLGGGAVLHAETQADLADLAVVFLAVTPDAVATRLRGSKRPLLRNGMGDWTRIYQERRPIYEALASVRFDTSNRPIDRIVDDVVAWVRERS